MSDLSDLQNLVVKFRDDRDWKKFHNPKDLSISLVDEAVELLNEFKWKNDKEIENHIKNNPDSVSDELMDVLYHVLLMCHDLNIDIPKEFNRKMAKNIKKYPISKSKGLNKKYTEL